MTARGARVSSTRWWKNLKKAALESSRSKPAFSHSWINDIPKGRVLDSKENRFVKTCIIAVGEGRTYSIDPYEYNMSTPDVSMVISAITPIAAAFLSLSIAGRRTMLIAGPRGAGKTSLLSSLLFEVERSQKAIEYL